MTSILPIADDARVCSARLRWVILTGEYPPQPGGVSDYTRLIARALADSGDDVRVCAPACEGAAVMADPEVTVYRLRDHVSLSGLIGLEAYLKSVPKPYNLLVQYVPQAFGWKGVNLPLSLWLLSKKRQGVWVMFHEVCTPLGWKQPVAHMLLGIGTRVMAAGVVRAAERAYVSTAAWRPLLAPLAPKRTAIQCLPIASNLPVKTDPAMVAHIRETLTSGRGTLIIGHFGTYGDLMRPSLAAVLPSLLNDRGVVGCLIGRRSDDFASSLVRQHQNLAGRLYATRGLAPEVAAAYIAACDLLVQPYPDGVTTRRGSLMAALALGRPIVTTDGALTEPIWRETGAVVLASTRAEVVREAQTLMHDPDRRLRQGARAASVYAGHFALEHTVRELRSAAAKKTCLDAC